MTEDLLTQLELPKHLIHGGQPFGSSLIAMNLLESMKKPFEIEIHLDCIIDKKGRMIRAKYRRKDKLPRGMRRHTMGLYDCILTARSQVNALSIPV